MTIGGDTGDVVVMTMGGDTGDVMVLTMGRSNRSSKGGRGSHRGHRYRKRSGTGLIGPRVVGEPGIKYKMRHNLQQSTWQRI